MLAFGAALLSLPLLVALAALIMVDSRGGPLHVAPRIGVGGRPFGIYKLRTMRQDAASSGPAVSLSMDRRITRVGRFLRRTRLDEVPQLWNVVRGEMRFVGPRPEDPRFVDFNNPVHRLVFRARPGITGPTQLAFAAEAEMLRPDDPEADYRTRILPAKVVLDEQYLRARSFGLDLWVLGQTLLAAAGRPPSRQAIDARLAVHKRAPVGRPD